MNELKPRQSLERVEIAWRAMVGLIPFFPRLDVVRCTLITARACAMSIGVAATIALGISDSVYSATATSATVPGLAPESSGFRQAAERERDAETLQTLTTEGRLLLSRDRIQLPAYDYCSMAVSAAERGDFRDSVEASARALVMARRTDNADLAALANRDLAIAYSYAGDLDDAAKYAHVALDSTPKAPEQVFAPANKVLGDIALRRHDPHGAIVAYNRALETASPRYRPMVLLSITNAQIAAGDTAAARKTFDAANPPPSAELAPAYSRIAGNLLLAEGKPEEARNAFSTLLSGSPSSDASYDRLWAHEGIGRADLALGNRAQAREAYLLAIDDSEKIRARFRSEEFKTGLFGDTQSVFEKAIELTVEVGDYASAWNLSERSRARALLDVVRNRVDAGVDIRQLNGDVPALDVVRNTLKPNEAIVEYHSLEKSIIAWVIRREGLQGYTLLVSRDSIEADVTALRNAIVNRQEATKASDKLYALLIAPLDLRVDERLIIVPHDTLHYLPFQALHSADGFLIERHPVALEPSASVAVQLAQREQRVASNLVAFGNPTIAPRYALPGAEAEVRGIAPLFARNEVFLQASATRVSFQDNAPAGRVLHVATHAQADTIDPLTSRILLAPAAQPADGPDALLAKDIYNVKLNDVSLVTLSACETGLGRIAHGDEILGFTRAFFYAGASSLIVSMWPVADESSAQTMRTFYSQLAEGHEAIDAMRTAQLGVMRNPRFAHPFFWAPFDLMGGWRLTIAR